ncbi:MAG: haloacid dehalogenase-like hydrolase, partial [Methylocystis sp.]
MSALAGLPALSALFAVPAAAKRVASDPLRSWNDTASKKALLAFVDRVTRRDSPDFVPEEERIATFDNDGTLWAEQPMYFQLLFALDRVR